MKDILADEDPTYATLEEAFEELTDSGSVVWRMLQRIPEDALAKGKRATAKALGRTVRRLNHSLRELDAKGYIEFGERRIDGADDGRVTPIVVRRRALISGRDRAIRIAGSRGPT